MPRASDNRGTCHADEVFDGQRWLSQAPGHGDLLRSTSDVQVCPYVPAVAGLRSRETYGYLCTFACTWHCTWICTPTLVRIAQAFNTNYDHNNDGPVYDRWDARSQAIISRAEYIRRHAECATAPHKHPHTSKTPPPAHTEPGSSTTRSPASNSPTTGTTPTGDGSSTCCSATPTPRACTGSHSQNTPPPSAATSTDDHRKPARQHRAKAHSGAHRPPAAMWCRRRQVKSITRRP